MRHYQKLLKKSANYCKDLPGFGAVTYRRFAAYGQNFRNTARLFLKRILIFQDSNAFEDRKAGCLAPVSIINERPGKPYPNL